MKNKNFVKVEPRGMSLAVLEKKIDQSFTLQQKSNLMIWKLKPAFFVRNGNSIKFYLIIDTDVMQQCKSTVPDNDVKIDMHENKYNVLINF